MGEFRLIEIFFHQALSRWQHLGLRIQRQSSKLVDNGDNARHVKLFLVCHDVSLTLLICVWAPHLATNLSHITVFLQPFACYFNDFRTHPLATWQVVGIHRDFCLKWNVDLGSGVWNVLQSYDQCTRVKCFLVHKARITIRYRLCNWYKMSGWTHISYPDCKFVGFKLTPAKTHHTFLDYLSRRIRYMQAVRQF